LVERGFSWQGSHHASTTLPSTSTAACLPAADATWKGERRANRDAATDDGVPALRRDDVPT